MTGEQSSESTKNTESNIRHTNPHQMNKHGGLNRIVDVAFERKWVQKRAHKADDFDLKNK